MRTEDKERIEKLVHIVQTDYPKLEYHGAKHGLGVWNAARQLARKAGVSYDGRLALEAAALGHDRYVVLGQEGLNERRSSASTMNTMNQLGFKTSIVENSGRLILVTTMPQRPVDELDKLMCDADLYSLGSVEFPEWSDRLRKEWGKEDNFDWWKTQFIFLDDHKYHSEAARKLWGKQKEKNLEAVKRKLATYVI